MSMKVLFLDVDGVLHAMRMEVKDGKVVDEHCFNPSCCQQLKRIVHETGAEIVLSSSWRCFEGPRTVLASALQEYGLSFRRWITTQPLPGGRAAQILDWLALQGPSIGNWAVVDDEDVVPPSQQDSIMMQVVQQRFVKTNPDVGLSCEEADKLIQMLNEDSDST